MPDNRFPTHQEVGRYPECRSGSLSRSPSPAPQPRDDGSVFTALTWSQNAREKIFTKCSFPMTGTSDAKPFLKRNPGRSYRSTFPTGASNFSHLPAFSGLPGGQSQVRQRPLSA